MADTTIDEASRCPRCKIPGEQVSDTPVKGSTLAPGTRVLLLYCRNDACRWYNTAWPVQVRPDGTVPIVEHNKNDKTYPGMMSDAESARIANAVSRQYQAETQPGGAEVINPNSRR